MNKKIVCTVLIVLLVALLGICGRYVFVNHFSENTNEQYSNNSSESDADGSHSSDYGVYLSDTFEELPDNVSCNTLVIDAQYFTADEIAELHKTNGEIYSYINVGSIEDFRDYYTEYADLVLGAYENWDEEYWLNVGDQRWQDFVLNTLASELVAKGVDGFFVDNVDVYYNYPEDEIYNGVAAILQGLKATGKKVMINGGDVFVTKYLDNNGSLDNVLDAVNQESVYTSINWDDESFEENDSENRDYFDEYLARVLGDGKEAFVLEYTDDSDLAAAARNYAARHGYRIYVSDSLELD
ncbi:MAG: endo alpha-1,4 polygalactosaminidase [Pseudobutyrivibrio sp.]|nr:endo alpha-1,4 polygalactosaminidase [Pseudobutyrivibrio sp.]